MPLSPIIDRLGRTLRGRNALLNVFELWVGLAGILTGIVFVYSGLSIESSAIDIAVGREVALAWNIGYFMAGVLIWWGLLRPSPRMETVALWGIGTSTAIEAIAVGAVFGVRGSVSVLLLSSLTAAAWIRATIVLHAALQLSLESAGRARGAPQ